MRSSTFILDKDDVKNKQQDGYHLDIWDDICDTFGLNPHKTIRIRISFVKVDSEAGFSQIANS